MLKSAMAKKARANIRDLFIGVVIGFLLAIIISSLFNAYIFKTLIRENRTQSQMIQTLLERN